MPLPSRKPLAKSDIIFPAMSLLDAHQRTIRDLRISLTAACNFRCFYCLPQGSRHGVSPTLAISEISRLAAVFVSLGIEKIRLTGGEPMLRRDLPALVEMLASLTPRPNIALTTNGTGFADQARALKQHGLDRATVSIDSLDRENFRRITGIDGLPAALKAVDAAIDEQLFPVKVNAVIVRGRNDNEIAEMAAFAREKAVAVRFIEFMPLDAGGSWQRDLVVSGREIRQHIDRRFPLVESGVERGSKTAQIFRFADGSPGSIGIIAPVTEPFCGACSRIRLTADGQLRTCLFSASEFDIIGPLRRGADDAEIANLIRSAVHQKEKGHHIDSPGLLRPNRSMSMIGG